MRGPESTWPRSRRRAGRGSAAASARRGSAAARADAPRTRPCRTFTQTSPRSTGVARCSGSRTSAGSTCASSGDAYASNTSPSSARCSRLLSIPNRTSPSGLPAVRSARVTTSPASPAFRIFSVSPLSASNACFTSFEIAKESCVTSTTSVGGLSPPPQPAPASSTAPRSTTAASRSRRVTRPLLV